MPIRHDGIEDEPVPDVPAASRADTAAMSVKHPHQPCAQGGVSADAAPKSFRGPWEPGARGRRQPAYGASTPRSGAAHGAVYFRCPT
jgi:hypothetical protein